MTRTIIQRKINAPIEKVFRTVADVEQFSKAIPHILKVEFLTENKTGIGACFRETRKMKDKAITTQLEVTEYIENDHVRMVASDHGITWDTVFSVRRENGQTVLNMTMDATTNNFFKNIMLYIIKSMVQKSIEQDMDSVKTFCELQK